MFKKRYAELSAKRFRTDPNTTRSGSRRMYLDSILKAARNGHCARRLRNIPRYTPSRSRPTRRRPVRREDSPTLGVRVVRTASITSEPPPNCTSRLLVSECGNACVKHLHATTFRLGLFVGTSSRARGRSGAGEEVAVNVCN